MKHTRRLLWTLLVVLVAATAIGVHIVRAREPFSRDRDGRPHGTGVEIFRYPSGSRKVEGWFEAGRPTITRWYRPSGELLAETRWDDGRGIGYVLRDDGSVAIKGNVAGELMDGRAWIYNEKGELEREAIFHKGREVHAATGPKDGSETEQTTGKQGADQQDAGREGDVEGERGAPAKVGEVQ